MASEKEKFAEAIFDLKHLGLELRLRSYLTPEEIHNLSYMINSDSDEIITAHERDRETARRRAERSAIYNMLESFPHDWTCNLEAVKKWLAMWQRNADDLCEGGKYAE